MVFTLITPLNGRLHQEPYWQGSLGNVVYGGPALVVQKDTTKNFWYKFSLFFSGNSGGHSSITCFLLKAPWGQIIIIFKKFMTIPVAFGSSWPRDWIRVAAVTYAAAVPVWDPLTHCGAREGVQASATTWAAAAGFLTHSGNSLRADLNPFSIPSARQNQTINYSELIWMEWQQNQ